MSVVEPDLRAEDRARLRGWRPSLDEMPLVASFLAADEILKSKLFRQDPGLELLKEPDLRGNLNSLNGEDHFRRRRAEAALFRRTALLHYEEEVLLTELRGVLRGLSATGRRPDGKVRT